MAILTLPAEVRHAFAESIDGSTVWWWDHDGSRVINADAAYDAFVDTLESLGYRIVKQS